MRERDSVQKYMIVNGMTWEEGLLVSLEYGYRYRIIDRYIDRL